MRISVIIPTYRRPDALEIMLNSLSPIIDEDWEVIVVHRSNDELSETVVARVRERGFSVRTCLVEVPGQVASLNAGLGVARGEFVAIFDDDVVVNKNWFDRALAHMKNDSRVGVVNGRDIIDGKCQDGDSSLVVGRLTAYGKPIGNHHLGGGEARSVEVCKGCNLFIRRAAIIEGCFSSALRGAGAQVCNDMLFSLDMKKAGWELMYDPNMTVEHYPAKRHDDDQRGEVSIAAESNRVFNETYAIYNYLSGFQLIIMQLFYTVVGTRVNRGLFQLLRFLPQGKSSVQMWRAHSRARAEAIEYSKESPRNSTKIAFFFEE